jgi:CheY-like chemotaxis protein
VESPSSISDDPDNPGSRFSFTIEVNSDEKIRKKFDFSHLRHYHEITALILSRVKDDSDRIHKVLDSFGINFNYRLYDNNTIDSVLYHIEQKKELYQLIIIKDKPKNDGFAMALQLKENKFSEKFPVLLISTNDKRGNYKKSRELSVDYYLVQPYETNEIFTILNENFQEIKEVKSIAPLINRIRSKLKILVADDNIINQRVIQTIFKHLGYEIDIAQNGRDVLEMHRENHYDIILMDLLMPEVDGFAACHSIRKSHDNVPIIAMTASDDSAKKD